MNVILTGMPGCGKSTISSKIAAYTGRTAVDTDAEIVKSYGEINLIFSKYGEQYFRDLESGIVEKFAGYDDLVISVGGGCVLRERNVQTLKQKGVIVYLKVSPAELEKRLKGDNSRPLLAGNLKERIAALYAERKLIYERAADYILETDGLTPSAAAQKITELKV